VEKVWRQLKREPIASARCAVQQLMRDMSLRGAVRRRKFKTTIAEDSAARTLDLVKRERTPQRWRLD
jgi:transposase InsO family protein